MSIEGRFPEWEERLLKIQGEFEESPWKRDSLMDRLIGMRSEINSCLESEQSVGENRKVIEAKKDVLNTKITNLFLEIEGRLNDLPVWKSREEAMRVFNQLSKEDQKAVFIQLAKLKGQTDDLEEWGKSAFTSDQYGVTDEERVQAVIKTFSIRDRLIKSHVLLKALLPESVRDFPNFSELIEQALVKIGKGEKLTSEEIKQTIMYAAYSGQLCIIKELSKESGVFKEDLGRAVTLAAHGGHLNVIQFFLLKGGGDF